VYISPIWGAKTPGRIEPKFFGGRHPRRYHTIQIWWLSVQGFWVGWESNFAFSHILWRSSLQHSHYRVRCDKWQQRLWRRHGDGLIGSDLDQHLDLRTDWEKAYFYYCQIKKKILMLPPGKHNQKNWHRPIAGWGLRSPTALEVIIFCIWCFCVFRIKCKKMIQL